MNMSPIKKIVLALAVVTVAISLITANNMASVMLLVASREANAAQQTQTNASVQTPAGNSGATNSGSTSQGSGTVTPSTNTGTSTGSTSTGTASTGSNTGNTGSTGNTSTNNNTQTDKPADDKKDPAADKTPGAKLSDQEVVDLYKKAMNNARTTSTSVVRVKDGAINYKKIVEAGKLSDIAGTLMGMFMKDSAEAIEVKNETWEKEKLPDASALTVNGLQKISYEEKDGQYIVTLVAKNASNPKAGADGVGAISGVIEESQITGAIGSVPGLTLDGISIDYENVTAVATIDKATGNLVALNLDAPCILNIGYAKVPLLGEVNDAKVGIQVITEYTVAY